MIIQLLNNLLYQTNQKKEGDDDGSIVTYALIERIPIQINKTKEIINRDYVTHIPYKRKRGQKKEEETT